MDRRRGLVTSLEVKEYAGSLKIALAGITTPGRLRDLPTGSVEGVKTLRSVTEELPSARSVMILAYHVWDPMFNLAVSDPRWRGYGMHGADEVFEWYQLYGEVVKNKAWQLVNYLNVLGHDAVVANNIPLKPAAVIAGLGCRGKNTLLVTPEYGPRVRLAAVLTSAELEPDEPFTEDLCGKCERCIHACPTGALLPHEIDIKRCLTYAAESPESPDVEEDVRDLERRLIIKPSPNSFVECTICQDACPIGRAPKNMDQPTREPGR